MVYVLDNTGKAIMPTERHGKVRRLLRDGKAHVVRLMPFTIQLDYENKSYTQEVSLGVDAGSVHIGLSATTEKKELLAAEVTLRTNIVEKISDRRSLRSARRFIKTRYRQKRVKNRRNAKGRIFPSIMYKVDLHLKIINFVSFLLPISKIIIEVAKFDIQKLKNSEIKRMEYCHGEMEGFWNVREYVLARDGHKCQHCKGKSGDKILNVHHLESRKTGGNAPNNLITLCETCHKAYHRGEFELQIKRGKSFRDAIAMNTMKWEIYTKTKENFSNVFHTFGYFTKMNRIKHGLEKSHHIDAFCISHNFSAKRMDSFLKMRCVQRHKRILHLCKPMRGGLRRRMSATHWIGNSRIQKYDTVLWNGIRCFVSGSTHGRLVLRDIDWQIVTPIPSVLSRTVSFIERKKDGMLKSYIKNK